MFEMTIQPRFSETDAIGHVSNTVMPTWFETARDPIFSILHPNMVIDGWPVIIAHIDVDYLRQIHLGHGVNITTQVEKVGTKSLTVYHEAWQQGRLAASGRAVLVYYDYELGETVAIPDKIKIELEKNITVVPITKTK